jgi:hypothetical protein
MEALQSRFGCTVYEGDAINSQVTHCVVPEHSRSLKSYVAVLLGKHVVTPVYI